jgi:hypothetical protein
MANHGLRVPCLFDGGAIAGGLSGRRWRPEQEFASVKCGLRNGTRIRLGQRTRCHASAQPARNVSAPNRGWPSSLPRE